MNEPNLPSDMGQHAGVEHHLCHLKPRRPLIDIDSIAIIADARVSATPVVIAATPPGKGRYSPSVLAGTVAASWICGVAVGASVALFFLSNSTTIDRNGNVAGGESMEHVQEGAVPSSTTPSRSEARMPEATMAEASLQSRPEASRWDFELGIEPLQAGMSLRSRNRFVRTDSSSPASALVRNYEIRLDHSDKLHKDDTPNFGTEIRNPIPSSVATQSELLRALLDSNRNIH